MPKTSLSPSPTRVEQAAWLFMAAALVLVLKLHLLPALLAGLLVYELVHLGAPMFARRLSSVRAKQAMVLLLATVVIGTIVLCIVLAVAFLRSDAGRVATLVQKMAEILENSRRQLPGWMVESIPDSVDGIKAALVHWLRTHASAVQLVGKDAVIVAAHVLVGMIVGGMLALLKTTNGMTPAHVFGKPSPSLLEPVLKRFAREEIAVVGDRLYTDKAMADRAGVDFICVLSGETTRASLAAYTGSPPAVVVEQFGEIAAMGEPTAREDHE